MTANNSRKFSVCRLAGTVVAILFLIVVVWLGGAPGIFVNVPSILLVLGLTFALLTALHGEDFLRFCGDAFLTFFLVKVPPNPRYAAIARSGSRFAVASGVIGSLMGVIQMLTTLDDPGKIGGGLAVALLTALYGLALSEFVFGFLQTAYTDPTGGGTAEAAAPARNLGIPIALLGLILTTFLMLILSFSVLDTNKVSRTFGRDATPFNSFDLPQDLSRHIER